MAKINVWGLRPQSRVPQTRPFQDIDEATGDPQGEPIVLTFQRMTEFDTTRALELADQLKAALIGDPKNNVAPTSPDGLPPAGGKPVIVTESMCINAAVMQFAQPENLPEEDRYDAMEFLVIRSRVATVTRLAMDAFLNEVKQPKKKANPVLTSDPAGTIA